MYRNNDFIYEAVTNLEDLTGIEVEIETSRAKYDALLRIKNTQFIVEAKSAMRTSNLGLMLNRIEELSEISDKPIIFIGEYISKDATRLLKERNFNYIDTAGNAFINEGDLTIYIEGKTRKTKDKNNQSRAFQEAGLKIIFYLLSEPENLQHSYRKIAQNVEVSLGSVSNVMAELEELNYLMKSKNKRVLKNKEDLLERWLIEYNEVLKPRITRTKMKIIDPDWAKNWKKLSGLGNAITWGGEPAGALITGNLKPEEFIIYSNLEIPELAKKMRLVPDKDGRVEVRQKFWRNDDLHIAPPLLVYTDLMNSGLGRNVEIANQIFENELQHIQ
ncbi:type IV toxin-antitoxin system AbiEi family antitoxin [Gramella jeungdoensis]|uniref:Type IV toxin-antitoxin system AbiEi family antitoxin n=1 Tax=Gramella jeungdoensis TaxID=708091 RepID=A0ABT0YZX7_9FLAO|nr:type IV toxin-antitoxin system AbiEi family antitoxin [Gramella jeungdoensis]MCM8568884.1 type IV toxin-antitoxin system AbiEi family antitoxin [Gramella jeungdoensis]